MYHRKSGELVFFPKQMVKERKSRMEAARKSRKTAFLPANVGKSGARAVSSGNIPGRPTKKSAVGFQCDSRPLPAPTPPATPARPSTTPGSVGRKSAEARAGGSSKGAFASPGKIRPSSAVGESPAANRPGRVLRVAAGGGADQHREQPQTAQQNFVGACLAVGGARAAGQQEDARKDKEREEGERTAKPRRRR